MGDREMRFEIGEVINIRDEDDLIFWEMEVLKDNKFCIMDWENMELVVVGDLKERGLGDMWKNLELMRMRRIVLMNRKRKKVYWDRYRVYSDFMDGVYMERLGRIDRRRRLKDLKKRKREVWKMIERIFRRYCWYKMKLKKKERDIRLIEWIINEDLKIEDCIVEIRIKSEKVVCKFSEFLEVIEG